MKKATTCVTCSERTGGMVGLIEHECERVLGAKDLTPSEKSTLLYIEGCCVDHDGQLDHVKMNWEDQQNIKVFQAAGWMQVEDFEVLEMSDRGWNVAHECRQERGDI